MSNATVRIFDHPDQLDPILDEWEALAASSGRPFAGPSWLLPWWSRIAHPKSLLRVLCVTEGSRLSLVMPMMARRTTIGHVYRFLGHDVSPHSDVVGSDLSLSRVVAEHLSRLDPRPSALLWDGVDDDSPWPEQLASAWPGTANLHREYSLPVPVLTTEGRTFDEWMASKSSNFRQKMRQQLRKFEAEHISFDVHASSPDWEREIAEFTRLHRSNWEARGGSGVVGAGVPEMLTTAAESLDGSGRFLLSTLRQDGKTVSSAIFIGAGDVLTYWLGGYDEEYAAMQPGLMTVFSTVQHAFDQGYAVIDLGPGDQAYKHRFSNGERTRVWYTLAPAGSTAALQRAHLAPERFRMNVLSSMDPRLKHRLRKIRERLSFG